MFKPAFQACQPLNNTPDVCPNIALRRQSKNSLHHGRSRILLSFQDDATAFKRGSIAGRRILPSPQRCFSTWRCGIPTHFIDCPSLIKCGCGRCNFASRSCCQEHCGRESQQTGLPGHVLKQPLVEFYYKNQWGSLCCAIASCCWN